MDYYLSFGFGLGGSFLRAAFLKHFMRYLLFILLLSSCQTRYGYAKAKFTHFKGQIKIEVIEPFKPMPDTTVIVNVIRRIKK